MSISISSSGPAWGDSAYSNFARMRNLKASTAMSLLPAPGPALSGMALGRDMYEVVAKQNQGLYSGGRTAIYTANAVLGIDMSQTFKNRDASGAEQADTE
jgi:hypothetical protein